MNGYAAVLRIALGRGILGVGRDRFWRQRVLLHHATRNYAICNYAPIN